MKQDWTNKAIKIIEEVFHCNRKDIYDITVMKAGMTNRSYVFGYDGKKYIIRVQGEGTEHLINRKQEAAVYQKIKGLGLCDDPVYIDGNTGYKITRYIENARVCDPASHEDVKFCMNKLKSFHEMGIKVEHEFDLFEKILFYESLWDGKPSAYKDYDEVKNRIFELKGFRWLP